MAGLKSLAEDLAMGRSSRADTKFDTTVGHIEDIIMGEYFHDHNTILCLVALIENYIEEELKRRMPGFSMEEFSKSLEHRQDQIGGDILEILLSFTDFLAFKQMFLDYKAEKEGTGVDLSNLLTITSGSLHVDESQGMQIDPDSPREGPSASR
ncbi:PREDICTED: ADP-ribosylation factor-like protein 2-binding protein [Acropora digitifera]|uniref:ADP-ribosylation factor-like protein 2-binding protein n=1 Tax=Acropora digitifera TaxID=70779 RepID=UPI00077AB288|nr:PREDICTED: ADP-ribosylation factor-like protein 2-binding protein [Acropora digitifera]